MPIRIAGRSGCEGPIVRLDAAHEDVDRGVEPQGGEPRLRLPNRLFDEHPHRQAIDQPPRRRPLHFGRREVAPPQPAEDDRGRLARTRRGTEQLREFRSGGQAALIGIGRGFCRLLEEFVECHRLTHDHFVPGVVRLDRPAERLDQARATLAERHEQDLILVQVDHVVESAA